MECNERRKHLLVGASTYHKEPRGLFLRMEKVEYPELSHQKLKILMLKTQRYIHK